MEIYSVEPCNIQRARRASRILSWQDWINLHIPISPNRINILSSTKIREIENWLFTFLFASLFDFLTLYLLSRKQNSWTKGWHGNVHVFSQLQWQWKFYLFQILMTRNWQWTKLQENKKRFNNKFCIRVLNTRVYDCF